MNIEGINGMTAEQIAYEVQRGGRFVMFQYCISALIISFRRSSPIYFVRTGESAASKGAQWTLLTLLLGWWGIPWGLIWTPMFIFGNLSGGKDVTAEVMPFVMQAMAPPPPYPTQPYPNQPY